MEIGRQFLMLQIDSKITSDDLSILVFNDRLVFCTLDEIFNFDLEKNNVTNESLKTWVNLNNIKKKNSKCILFEGTGVIVPHELFDKSKQSLYLSLSESNLNNKKIGSKIIQAHKQVLVFTQSRDWSLLFKDLFIDIETTHFCAELIPFLSRMSSDNLKKSVFIHIRKDFFDLFIYQGSQLLLFNSFPHQDEEDFLYYLFFVLEQFCLKENQFSATFLGKFLEYQKYYEVFNEFHALTNFTYPENLKVDSKNPAPFFNYFYCNENNIRKV